MIAMSGTRNKALDAGGKYREQCTEFASSLGWDSGSVYGWWKQCALLRELESGWPRPLAEWMAMRDVLGLFDKRGQCDPD